MSRNLRIKYSGARKKTSSRRSSRTTNHSSSDDDYAGVDLISDSEEDEPDVEVAEEQAIIDSAEEDDDDTQDTPRPSQDDDQSSWNGFEVDSEEDLGEHNPFFDEQFGRTHPSVNALFDDVDNVSPTRRVRFDLSDDNSAESEDDLDGLFPDIFLPQDRLDPGFRRLLERDDDQDSSGNESYWDINNSDENSPSKMDDGSDSDSDSAGSSGYDSEGETTDEDLPPAAKFAPAKTILRRPSEEEESEAEEEINPRRGPIRSKYPKLGSWVQDPTRAYAIIGKSKRLIFFQAVKRRHSTSDVTATPRTTRSHNLDSPPPIFSADVTPMISNSANLMMSAMSTPYDDLFRGQAIGPSEAFFPFTSVDASGAIYQNIDDYEFDEDDFSSPEDMLDIRHYIDFNDSGSEDENGDEDPSSDSQTTSAEGPAVVRPTTAVSEDQVHPLLNHFDSGIVGAFRKNQTRHQLLSRNAESHASLAFHGPNRPVRGIKGGRLEAANTPITPLRKQKMRPLIPPADSSPLAHLTGGGIEEKKRKFDMEEAARGHKRTRSLV